MSAAFARAIAFVLPHEEEFARGHWGDEAFVVAENVPGDAGGLTKYGIDQRSHPHVDVANLTKEAAIRIYAIEWNRHNLDQLPERLAIALFDVMVNGGRPITWLQEAINYVANPRPLLAVDGDCGSATITAACACDQPAVLEHFLHDRDARFRRLAEIPEQAQFLAGWLQRDEDLRRYLGVGKA